MRVERLADTLEAAQDEWRRLAEAAQTPFATYEWARAWWEVYGRGSPTLLGCRREDGTLAALLPLEERRRGPVRVARFVGHGAADELGPVCAPDDRPAALAALRAISTDGLLHSDLVLAERLPDEPGVQEGFGGRVLQREPNPAIASAGLSWEDYLARRSRNFREQVRRRERALRRGHEVAFRLSADPARLDADLTILFALHDRRWAGTGSGALAGSAARFHRAFASEALARGWLRLWVMEVDGEPAAAWYGLRYGGREWYYQSGRDPAWDGASVGFVLLAHTIREAMRDGVSEYRLLRGGEAYKARFATVDHPLVTCVAPATAIGQAAAAVLGAIDLRRPRLRAALKRAVR